MTVEWNKFWCRVLFKEFIKHFRKLTDEQIVSDIRNSMDDLEDMVDDTDTFGSQMVRWANERANEPAAIARRENGKKGGRPKKIPDGSTFNSDGDSLDGVDTNVPGIPSDVDLYDFVASEGLDEFDARQWFDMCNDRRWLDRSGNPIANWKGALKRFCAAKARKRGKENGR